MLIFFDSQKRNQQFFENIGQFTIRYYYTRSRKSKWPELVAKYQVQWTRIIMNTKLDSSVRIKSRIHTEVT